MSQSHHQYNGNLSSSRGTDEHGDEVQDADFVSASMPLANSSPIYLDPSSSVNDEHLDEGQDSDFAPASVSQNISSPTHLFEEQDNSMSFPACSCHFPSPNTSQVRDHDIANLPMFFAPSDLVLGRPTEVHPASLEYEITNFNPMATDAMNGAQQAVFVGTVADQPVTGTGPGHHAIQELSIGSLIVPVGYVPVSQPRLRLCFVTLTLILL
jgi:hypothetical protein